MHAPVVKIRQRIEQLKGDTLVLYVAYRDERVPWYAKVLAACVVAYAFSPVDLIPDFVPVVGYLDDLVLVPLGIALALRMIPADVMAESRLRVQELETWDRPRSWVAGGVVIAIWMLLVALALLLLARDVLG